MPEEVLIRPSFDEAEPLQPARRVRHLRRKVAERRPVVCEFCHKHGEGRKWYLQAQNYSEDLLSDARRKEFIQHFFTKPRSLERDVRRLEALARAPKPVRDMVTGTVSRRQKKSHFGQVVPIEDIERIFEFTNSVVRVACICRHVTLGKEKRYCYGASLGPNGGKMAEILRGLDGSFLNGPHAAGLESLGREEALTHIRAHEREGLCHTVWTFHTPFIGGICNCDRADCLAMRTTVTHGVPVMFRAETIASVDPDLCTGCRQCMRVCQFGAVAYSASDQKVRIDQRWCYGCGICRSQCAKGAIRLESRSSVPAVAGLW
jgi:Pyruvate/2-oxoacid:ferredoxin oxidoreductase delta subunit